MGVCAGGRESPCTFNLRKNRNTFRCFGFCLSSCRQLERSGNTRRIPGFFAGFAGNGAVGLRSDAGVLRGGGAGRRKKLDTSEQEVYNASMKEVL